MAFRIRKKRKGGEKVKQGKQTSSSNEKDELAERDALAEFSRRPQKDNTSDLDHVDDEP